MGNIFRSFSFRMRSNSGFIHAVKPEADRGFPQALPPTTHSGTRGAHAGEHAHDHVGDFRPHAPRSLRMMEGFGVHTFRFVKRQGNQLREVSLASRLGMQSTLWDEAVKISGADPDYHRRDLWEAITTAIRGMGPWDSGVR